MLTKTPIYPSVLSPQNPPLRSGYAPSYFQKTIGTALRCHGIGLHSGKNVTIQLLPAPENHGIVFKRTDLPGARGENLIPASWQSVQSSQLCTTIQNDHGVKIATIEHLLAALAGLEIDNILIEIDGDEVPIMDGSSAPFVFLLECAGIIEQSEPRRYIEILKPVTVREQNGHGEKSASVHPSTMFSIDCAIEFDNSCIARQSYSAAVNPTSFKNDIARARTFGFLQDVDQMHAAGLGLAGSLENSIVVDGNGVLNEEGLRFKDEFVRHKALDCIGDLYLAGYPILGHVETYRSGHALNNRLLRALFADKTAWRLVTAKAQDAKATEQDNAFNSLSAAS